MSRLFYGEPQRSLPNGKPEARPPSSCWDQRHFAEPVVHQHSTAFGLDGHHEKLRQQPQGRDEEPRRGRSLQPPLSSKSGDQGRNNEDAEVRRRTRKRSSQQRLHERPQWASPNVRSRRPAVARRAATTTKEDCADQTRMPNASTQSRGLQRTHWREEEARCGRGL